MLSTTCEVVFDGMRVGALALPENQAAAVFEYTPEWLAEGFSIAPLHLPLRKGSFSFPHLSFDTYKGLPAVFADSLPDDFGNALINAWLARKGLNITSFGALDRLLDTGKRGMGGLEYEPANTSIAATSFEIHLADLVTLAQDVLTSPAKTASPSPNSSPTSAPPKPRPSSLTPSMWLDNGSNWQNKEG